MAQYSGMWTLSQVSQAIKNNTWTGIPPTSVEYLIVAGGGAGASWQGGGGGAGGLLAGHCGIPAGASIFVTVGAGGAGAGSGPYLNQGANAASGGNSVLVAASLAGTSGNLVALGGGGGSTYSNTVAVNAQGSPGGSGGGGGSTSNNTNVPNLAGGYGEPGQGNNGGAGYGTSPHGGGGGGGAGGVGMSAAYQGVILGTGGDGGPGVGSVITSIVTTYAGGGGGSAGGYTTPAGSPGGEGGGAPGTTNEVGAVSALSGLINTGGGGGGHADGGANGGSGGSGVVILRYPGSIQYFTGGTVWATHDGFVVHSFISSDSLAPTSPIQLNPYPVAFGASYGGGYFAGRFTLSGTTYNLIVAPVASGYSASAAYKNANTGDSGADSYSNGLANSNAINDASHPAAQFCRALTIGGYTDWYLPSVDELNTVYNYLKPGLTRNSATPGLGGYNTGAVAPELYNTIHSAGRPRQTGTSIWKVGGAESFEENIYVTSTSDSGSGFARNQYFNEGYQWYDNKTNTANKVRAIRKVAI